MTLALDARQRAILAEMGIRTWSPLPAAAAALAEGRVTAEVPAGTKRMATPIAPAPRADTAPVGRVPAPVAMAQAVVSPPAKPAGEPLAWPELREKVFACTACALCEGRRNPVLGQGEARADWLVVGEAPGEGEELSGEPFGGQEGMLLDNMLRALGLGRGPEVYLTHALKCRAPGSRSPDPAEVARCEEFLRRQVELLQPRVILALGRLAALALVPGNEPLGKLRGRVHRYQGVPVVVSYAPAYLLRNLPEKARAWADLCLAQAVIDGTAG